MHHLYKNNIQTNLSLKNNNILEMALFFIPIVILALSVIVLSGTYHGLIHKNVLLLKTINIIHIVAVCSFYLFIILILPFFGGRDELVTALYIYALFGATTLISDIILLFINRFSKKEE